MTSTRQIIALAISIVICLSVAGLGSLLTVPSIEPWYSTLQKPQWTPPNWLFGPVWTMLYLCMAVAVWLVWREAGFAHARFPLALFAIQLALNVAWSGIFFGLRSTGFALVEIICLWAFILATTFAFWPASRVAALLMVPYLMWSAFAAILNAAIWRLNG
jgi:translocator protein